MHFTTWIASLLVTDGRDGVVSELRADLRRSQEEISKLRGEVRKLRGELSASRDREKIASRNYSELETSNVDAEDAKARLSNEISKRDAEIELLKIEVTGLALVNERNSERIKAEIAAASQAAMAAASPQPQSRSLQSRSQGG